MASQKEVADHLDISTSRVRQLILNGVIPDHKGPGGYDLDVCRLAYIRYLRGVNKGTVRNWEAEGEELPDDDYRAKLEQEKWRQARRENDLAEGNLAPIGLLQAAISATAAQMMPICESLPLEAKRRNPKLTGRDIRLLKDSVAKMRNILGTMKIDTSLI